MEKNDNIMICDIRKKKDIGNLQRGLVEVVQLRPVQFKWKEEFDNSTELNYGFIAQEFEEVIPELVGQDSQGYKYIQNAFQPLLVNAIKDLNSKYELEKSEHEQTKQQLELLKQFIQNKFPGEL